ncbi:MAG: response regulator [Leptonema sp. (in: Bacteria)]|nr:response regulator [Leptonema sp. (in: bacteria)]
MKRRLDKLIMISDHFQKVLQVSMQNKDRFVANLSHELRNPLGTIVGVTEELAKSDLNDDQVQLINVLQQASQSLLDVINEVLDLSRIQSGQSKTALNKFDLHLFLHSLIEQFQYHRFRRNVELNLTIEDSVPKYIVSDEHRIKQILMNLVSNALKFTEQGNVSLHTSLVDGDLIFEVIDTGIGIEQERINKLFRRFVQEDETISSRYGGTGLGLSIVHELTQLLGGTISVKSKKKEGSVFTLRLPFQSIDQIPNDKIIRNTINLEPPKTKGIKRILFVDDSKEQHWLLQRFLQSEPVQVVVATTGADALARFSERDFDLAIIDLQLPDSDGFQVLSKLRSVNSKILAIALSGQSISDNEMRASGFNDFIMKPYKKEELSNAIFRLI